MSAVHFSVAELASILTLSKTARLNDVAEVLQRARVEVDGRQLVAVSTNRYVVGRIIAARNPELVDEAATLQLDLVALKPFVASIKAATPKNLYQQATVVAEVSDDGARLVSDWGPAMHGGKAFNFPPVERLFPDGLPLETPAGIERIHVDAELIGQAAALRHPADVARPGLYFDWLLQPHDERGNPRPFVMRRNLGAASNGVDNLVEALVMPAKGPGR